VSFAGEVIRKYRADRGRALAAVVALYGLLSFFPLCLVLITGLGYALGRDPGLRNRLLQTAFGQFPVINDQLRTSIHGLHGHGLGLVIGVPGIAWGAIGVSRAVQFAMNEVWGVPADQRGSVGLRIVRGVEFLGLLFVGLALTTAAAAVGAFGRHDPLVAVAGVLGSALVNVGIAWCVFRLLSPARVPWRGLVAGAAVVGGGWVALQTTGGYLVGRVLRHASQLYGVFGLMLGLVWLFLVGAQLFVWAAEINAVRAAEGH
jgi:uncharacterized BrkB/YihY/UPF0761 family membrane protein